MCPQASGLVKSDPMNTTKGRVPYNYSTFSKSLSYKKNMCVRYADCIPSFEMEGVQKDDIRINTKDIIDSLSLNAPFKGTIRKIKESFKVPNMAMLPFNWDLIYTQPSVGGDVPADANTVFLDFPTEYSAFWMNLLDLVLNNLPTATSTDAEVSEWLTALMRMLVVGEYVYSEGSLLNFCGYKASAQFNFIKADVLSNGTYDQWFDSVITAIFSPIRHFTCGFGTGVKYYKGLVPYNTGITNERFYGSFRSFLDDFRENPLGQIYVQSASSPTDFSLSEIVSACSTLVTRGIFATSSIEFILPPLSAPDPFESEFTELNPNTLNYQRLLAYQLICAHFYSNSSVDVVYSAELYRQYVRALHQSLAANTQTQNFTLNGVSRVYDWLSGHDMSLYSFISASTGTAFMFTWTQLCKPVSLPNNILYRFAVLASLFAWRHSLRYGDYFVGARPRPLAPINSNVAVSGGYVSVIDITQKEWAQRFANAVMRSRQKVDDYVEMLFGKKPDIDYHNPLFLSREVDVVYGDEVQNTGGAQLGTGTQQANSRTSNMKGGLGQFTFTFHNDDMHPCVYMQIITFDIKRAYTRSVDRQFLHVDRYDMFNPDFQFIGDQPIYGIELGYPASVAVTPLSMPGVFAYQGRDMEYKQRFDVVCGGFERNLPGWILTDIDRSKSPDGVLSPDFIRNYNSELDQFFLSLTGYSLGTYFHFVCITQNNVYAKRAMSYDPQILG